MRVGYLPDMFGHVAQMPQMLRRAGIDRAVVWRGVPAAIDRNAFTWASPDGSAVEAEYLVGGYGNGAYLFDVPGPPQGQARRARRGERGLLRPAVDPRDVRHRPRGPSPSPGGPGRVRQRRRLAGRHPHGDARRVRRAIDGEAAPEPVDRAGPASSLRRPREHADERHVRAGRRQDRLRPRRAAPRALRRAADGPACGGLAGTPARAGLATGRRQLRARLDLRLLPRRGRGPGPDPVRGGGPDRARRLSGGRSARSRGVPTGAGRPSTLPAPREDFVEFDVAVPPEWESVALRFGGRRLSTQEAAGRDPAVADLKLHGSEIPELFRRRGTAASCSGGRSTPSTSSPTIPTGRRWCGIRRRHRRPARARRRGAPRPRSRRRCWPGRTTRGGWWCGPRSDAGSWPVCRCPRSAGPRSRSSGWRGRTGPNRNPWRTRWSRRSAAGERPRAVEVDDDGTFRLAGGGITLEGVGRMVDGGDWVIAQLRSAEPDLVEIPTSVEVEAPSGPLRGRLTIRRRFDWPVGIDPRERVRTPPRSRRTSSPSFELRAGEPFVRVEVSFENRSRDHRVRFHVPPRAGDRQLGRGPVRGRRARPRGRGRARRGAAGDLPGPRVRPDRGCQRAARSHRRVRGRRRPRARLTLLGRSAGSAATPIRTARTRPDPRCRCRGAADR